MVCRFLKLRLSHRLQGRRHKGVFGINIGVKTYEHITVTGKNGEVLAVISDSEIIEKEGIAVEPHPLCEEAKK